MLTVIAKLQAVPGKEAELRAVFEEMIGKVKANEPGVVKYSLHTADNDPTLFMFYEQYESSEAFEAHGKTDHMRAMGGKLAGLLGGRPVIERYTQIAGV